MPEFLKLVSTEQARQIFYQHLPAAAPIEEWVDTVQAVGRITAAPVITNEESPAFSRSTVDGYALRARDTFGAAESMPMYLTLVGEVPMGDSPAFGLNVGECAVIHTGGMLPEGADAVLMLEYSTLVRPGEIELMKSVTVGENVVWRGEDVHLGQEIFPVGKCLRPADIGGLLALGITRVAVARPPRVGILSSGDEVIPPDQTPRPGQVRDINSFDLSALVDQCGGIPRVYGIIPDKPDLLKESVNRAIAENDMVVVTAGSSASVRDFTSEVINSLGEPGVLVHGIQIRPGKPTILAVCQSKPVIGLPGNPVSALVIAYLFVKPVVEYLLGQPLFRPQPTVAARLLVNVASQAGREEWIPVKFRALNGRYEADPIFFKSSLIFNLAWADGMFCIPADANGLEAGSQVEVILF